jgi:thiamine-phosphate pyrophosphorylase
MTTPKCRLFLVVPSALDADTARACLEAAIATGDVAAIKVTGSTAEQQRLLDAVLTPAHRAGIAVLTENDVDLALRHKTDGVEVEAGVVRLVAARRILGKDAIVAAHCGTSRHQAMEMAEAGANYVTLVADGEGGESLIAWWAELFEVPCVVVVDSGEAAQAIADGADFLVPSADMWVSPQAAQREIAAVTAMITETAA